MPITAKSLKPHVVSEWRAGEVFGPTAFGTTLSYVGRASYFDNGLNENPEFAVNMPVNPVFGTSGGSGRGADLGLKAIPPDLGAAVWDYTPLASGSTSRIPISNGELYQYPLTRDDEGNVYSIGQSADGVGALEPGSTVNFVAKIDTTGNLVWYLHTTSTSISNTGITVTPDGSRVIAYNGGTWDGGVANDEIAILDGSGTLLGTVNNNDLNVNYTRCQIFGANSDRVLFWAVSGTFSGAETLQCVDLTDLESDVVTELWTLDKTLDFGATFDKITFVIVRPDGGLLLGSETTSDFRIIEVSEDGVVGSTYDLATEFSGLGASPVLDDMKFDKFGELYVLANGIQGSDIARFDSSYSRVWRASDTLAQGAANGTNLGLDVPLMSNGASLALNDNGTIFVGEGQATGITSGYVAVFTQTGPTAGGDWSLNGLWGDSPFDSLPRGKNTLWHHAQGTGRHPNHTGYGYTGGTIQDVAESPTVDLTPFVNPDGSGNNESFWTVYARLWYRPNRNKATLGGVEQMHDRLWLLANIGGDDIEIGEFSNFDQVRGPLETTSLDYLNAHELSRISSSIPGVRASETFTLTVATNMLEDETIVVDEKTYTFKANVDGAIDGQVKIGADGTASMANLAAAINLDPTAGLYSPAMTANPDVTATAGTLAITVAAATSGTAGNSIAISETATNGAWSGGATTLSGGVDAAVDANVGDSGEWWCEQIICPTLEQQALLLGQNVTWKLSLEIAERDASDYGTGIARFSIEVIRDNVQANAFARGGFGKIPPVEPDFPIELYRSWANSRRWR